MDFPYPVPGHSTQYVMERDKVYVSDKWLHPWSFHLGRALIPLIFNCTPEARPVEKWSILNPDLTLHMTLCSLSLFLLPSCSNASYAWWSVGQAVACAPGRCVLQIPPVTALNPKSNFGVQPHCTTRAIHGTMELASDAVFPVSSKKNKKQTYELFSWLFWRSSKSTSMALFTRKKEKVYLLTQIKETHVYLSVSLGFFVCLLAMSLNGLGMFLPALIRGSRLHPSLISLLRATIPFLFLSFFTHHPLLLVDWE